LQREAITLPLESRIINNSQS